MLTLGISTSFSHFALVLGEKEEVLFNSVNVKTLDSNRIETILSRGLKAINRDLDEISEIIVDNGPGGTSSVRTGVAFANALGYCLNIDVIPVSSFTILGFAIYSRYSSPVLLSAKSIKGNAFWGYFNDNRLQALSFGTAELIVPQIVSDTRELIVAGCSKELIHSVLPNVELLSFDKRIGNIDILIKNKGLISSKSMKFPKLVMPVTENNLDYE